MLFARYFIIRAFLNTCDVLRKSIEQTHLEHVGIQQQEPLWLKNSSRTAKYSRNHGAVGNGKLKSSWFYLQHLRLLDQFQKKEAASRQRKINYVIAVFLYLVIAQLCVKWRGRYDSMNLCRSVLIRLKIRRVWSSAPLAGFLGVLNKTRYTRGLS